MRVFKPKGKPVWHCYVYELEGGKRRRRERSTGCRDKQAAIVRARQLERDAADPLHARRASATVEQALTLLLERRREEERAGRCAKATVSFYETKAGHWVRVLEGDPEGPAYRPYPLVQFTAGTVDTFISARRAEGAADHTIAKELGAMRVALKLAKRAGLWSGDLGEIFPPAFAPAYVPRQRWLPAGELSRLLAELSPDKAARVAFIVATSASWSESESARREDVAGDASTVLLRGTKRPTRWRTVPIETEAQRSLLAHALAHAAGEGGRLFLPWGNVRHDLIAACRRAEIERCSPNDLRRSFAHWLRAEGVPLELLAPMMGHASTRMVQAVYGKLGPGELAARIRLHVTKHKPDAGGNWTANPATLTVAPGLPRQGDAMNPPRNEAFAVPRDGIEPPTRGFSNQVELSYLWPNPRVSEQNAGQFQRRAATVRQPRKGAA